MSIVVGALALAPSALAGGSTLLDGYGTNAAKPVVQVKGTSETVTPVAVVTAKPAAVTAKPAAVTPKPAAKPVTSVKTATASAAPATLPFTGSDLLLYAAAGIVLLSIGFGLRRVGRDRP